MEINYVAAKFWFDIVQTLGIVCVGLYTAWSGKNKVTSKKISALGKKYDERFEKFEKEHGVKCADHHQRTARLEVMTEKAPDHDDLGEIHEKINDVYGSVERLCGQLGGVSENVRLIHEHLLEGD